MEIKRILSSLTLIILTLTSCNSSKTKLENIQISEDTKFKSCTVLTTKDELSSQGIELGDSVDIKFSNGFNLTDVPYYNGYYVKTKAPVMVAYPSSPNIVVTYNNIGIWEQASLNKDDTVNIYLNTSKKYLVTQQALSQSYSLDRNEYTSDEEFSNFRQLKGGSIKENVIYRGASSLDNSRNRAKITDNLLKKNNIQTIIDLADSNDDISSYLQSSSFESDYTKQIIDNNNLIPLNMSSSYTLIEYKQSVAKGLRFLINKQAPYYVHCMEGKDRTGFVCCLLEGLCGASYNQMLEDYMLTYQNYFKVNKEKTLDKYNAIVDLYFNEFMDCLLKNENVNDYENIDYTSYCKSYLKEGGMNDEEINQLIEKLTK